MHLAKDISCMTNDFVWKKDYENKTEDSSFSAAGNKKLPQIYDTM